MDRELLAALVASASTPASADGSLSRLAARCWPGAADATVPAARDWVRRWGPTSFAAVLPQCACAAGRCGACN